MSDWAPERIWLQREMGEQGSHTWCEDEQGGDIEEAEYVRADAASARLAQLEGWHKAVLDACMVREGCYDSTDPEKAVRQLLDWEYQTAIDPAVSEAAQVLRANAAAMVMGYAQILMPAEKLKALKVAVAMDLEKVR
jgi:hypothetical protein